VSLQINSLGSNAARGVYRERLVAYFKDRLDALDEDSRRRLHANPLRILDTKNPEMKDLVAGAPLLLEHLDDESRRHFERLRVRLDAADIRYEINPYLVRGLDYYSRTVFEWVTDRLGAQGTVCAGGRYDGLVEQLGGRPTPAVGFAIGLERLITMLAGAGYAERDATPHAYLVLVGRTAEAQGPVLAERLRDRLPALRLLVNCGEGGFKAQLKRADRSGAQLALILGEDEAGAGRIAIKPLREPTEQIDLPQRELAEYLRAQLL
jgi:histidyl-tRNA synthetase